VLLPLVLISILILAVACGSKADEDGGSRVESIIKTERLEITDKDGVTRAVLATLDDGRPSLTMIDEQGRDRAWLFLSTDGSPNLILIDKSRFALMDRTGEIRSALRIDDTGSPMFSYQDASGRLRSLIRLGEDGAPVSEFYGEDGLPVWSAL